MSNDSYNRGGKDAANNKGPANLSNAPWKVQQDYNAGFAAEKEKQKK